MSPRPEPATTHVFLTGPMGAGKTTVGRILAEALALPFVDLDAAVEGVAGMSVPDIFLREGEAGFRAREAEALARVVEGPPAVVATGGGVVLVPENRQRMRRAGRVVFLDADPAVLAARVGATEGRPLLAGVPAAAARLEVLRRIAEGRRALYRDCDLVVDASPDGPEAVAAAVIGRLDLPRVVRLDDGRSYPVAVVPAGAEAAGSRVAALLGREERDRCFVVADRRVLRLHGAAFLAGLAAKGVVPAALVEVPPGERSKSFRRLEEVTRSLVRAGMDREGLVVALGGGVTGDLAGFAAASLLRGVRWAVVPTTLLAQVDASVGGKTAINVPEGKNLVGAFHQPSLVVSPTATLDTLPRRRLLEGLAEAVKTGLVADPGLFTLIEGHPEAALGRDLPFLTEVVRRCVHAKARVVESDERESGARRILNFGHTVGHALEAAGGYRLVTHGEAVAIGMVVAVRLSSEMGLAGADLETRVASCLKALRLPTEVPPRLHSKADLMAALLCDKKRTGGRIRLVGLAGIGHPVEVVLDPGRVVEAVLGSGGTTP